MGFLEIHNLCKSFDTVGVINDFSMELVELTLCCLVGPNGAGKTTTMDLITGRQKPTSGRIVFCEDDITGLDEHEIARRGIGRKFQVPAVFRDLTVHQNLEVAYSRSTHPLKNMFRFRDAAVRSQAGRGSDAHRAFRTTEYRGGDPVARRNAVARDRHGADAESAASADGRARRRDDRGRDRQDSRDSSTTSSAPIRSWSWSTTWRSCVKSPTSSP